MNPNYQYLCGFLKANERKLFNDEEVRGINTCKTVDEIKRYFVDSFFEFLIPEELDFEFPGFVDKNYGRFIRRLYFFPGREAVFYAMLDKVLEAFRVIQLRGEIKKDNYFSCGFSAFELTGKKKLGEQPLSGFSDYLHQINGQLNKAEGLNDLEIRAFISERNMKKEISSMVGGPFAELNKDFFLYEDALMFFWFARTGKLNLKFLKEHNLVIDILTSYFKNLIEIVEDSGKDKPDIEVLEKVLDGMKIEEPALADYCKELLNVKNTEEVDDISGKYMERVWKKYYVSEVGPLYPVYFLKSLNNQLELVKKNVYRVLSLEAKQAKRKGRGLNVA